MSAVFAGVSLCQSTPEVRAWVERHVPLREARPAQWHASPPTIFHGLTYFPHDEANVPLRLNVLRWPSGASRWATYHFLATDEQLVEIKAEVYGDPDADPPEDHRTAARTLTLHGGGDTITAEQMWMLPPRPLSETPSWLTQNRLWLCTLVDQRYYWQLDHCGDLSECGTWDELLEQLRDRAGFGTLDYQNAWDCPAVDAVWLQPHVDLLAAHSLPLGMMIDAVAWNVGRRVSIDMEQTSEAYPPIVRVRPYTWHDTRATANLATTSWYRMAGGDYAFATPNRDLSAALPEKVRVTFADGVDRDYTEFDTTYFKLIDYTNEHGKGTVVFHDRLDVGDATDGERNDLTIAIAKAYLGFTAKAAFDVTFTGHAKWLPEALSDAIEWHELHGEGECLVPDPADGKVRKRLVLGDMARTRIVRPPFNLLADDLWHGNGGAGSGSVPEADYTGTCPDGTTFTVTVNGNEITVTMDDEE
jgi:hypothetical protein